MTEANQADTAAAGGAAPPAQQEKKTPTHLTVLILRAERVGNVDYAPGDTPKLAYDQAQHLIKRGGADADRNAVRQAKARQKQADEQDQE